MAENMKKTSPIHSAATIHLDFDKVGSKDISQLSNDSCFKVPKSIVKLPQNKLDFHQGISSKYLGLILNK